MKNFEIYRKTLPFSLRRLLLGAVSLLACCAIVFLGYYFTRGSESLNVPVTAVCAIVGLIAFALVMRYFGYMLKAGQIAMITRGVTEGALPDDVVEAGKAEVKNRFITANAYFFIASGIKGITNQITRGVSAATSALGGLTGDSNTGNAIQGIGALISAFIAIVLEYVNYCCLGWVFYKKDQNAFKSTCDGAVIYFQNWKTLLKNAGKVLGLSIVSLLIIGGILSLITCSIAGNLVDVTALDAAVVDAESGLTGSDILYIMAVAVAIAIWALLHSVFVTPYFLVSVMRSYMDSARTTVPGVDIYEKLCGLSKKFANMFKRSEEPAV